MYGNQCLIFYPIFEQLSHKTTQGSVHPNLVKNLYNKDIVIRRVDGLTKTDGDRSQKLRRDDK